MSRAFVKEPDGDSVQDETPDIPISPHPNFVTRCGLAQLEAERDDLLAQRSELKKQADPVQGRLALFPVERRLRYVVARLESAILRQPENEDIVRIGHQVLVADDEDVEMAYLIVGEDEADIAQNKVSWVSPLARALLDAEVGDMVRWKRPAGVKELEIIEISSIGS